MSCYCDQWENEISTLNSETGSETGCDCKRHDMVAFLFASSSSDGEHERYSSSEKIQYERTGYSCTQG